MEGLAQDGHEVTMVSPFTPKKPIENYKTVVLERAWDEYEAGKLVFEIQFN